ncbi:MAG: prolipoprotein diacylglyceryl transferase [Gemmatimonadetes bacterium]|nr:prolipoprotein diacylglyceryl transferase [Gemmatimonadota bacterium]MYD26106.1 prolipoprotein diacylglyceryl transferase [Gemmatimonadota bacterium]MYI99815.1 prolipoprotein diacylglyceryl transferase [Gemmatimonadota bacterium]
MHPILFEIGPFTVRTYGLLLAVSFIAGILLALRRSRARGLNQNQMINMSLLIMLAGIVGARIMYVIPHWNEFSANPLDIISPFQSSGSIGLTGLTMYGGFIAAVLVSILYLRVNRLSIWKACDAFAPSIALGIGISRVGCFMNGCCFGLPTESALGVVFPAFSAAGSFYPDVALHPAQLYNAVLGFGLFGLLMWLDRKPRYDGFLFAVLLIAEPVTRFFVDLFRYYESSMTLGSLGGIALSVNQGISLVLIGLGLLLLGWTRNRARQRSSRSRSRHG